MVISTSPYTKITRIAVRSGSEGPKHDPYHFREIEIIRGTKEEFHVILHRGLRTYIQFRKGMIQDRYYEDDYAHDPTFLDSMFQSLVGLSIEEVEKAIRLRDNPKKCRHCGSKKWQSFSGHLGETFTLCHNDHVASYHFNRSAIV